MSSLSKTPYPSAIELQSFNLLSIPVWILDLGCNDFYWANTAALNLWGTNSLEEWRTHHFTDMPSFDAQQLQRYLQCFEKNTRFTEEWTFFETKGGPVTLNCVCSGALLDGRPSMLIEGHPQFEQNEDALRGLEAVRYAPILISMFNMRGELIFQNPAASKVFGPLLHEIFPQEPSAQNFRFRFLDQEEAKIAWQEILESGSYHAEQLCRTKQGLQWHEYNCRLTQDPVRQDIVVLVHQQDISDRKRAENQLRHSEERYRQLFVRNKAVELLIDPQEDGQIVDANLAAADFYGYPLKQLTKMKISDINILSKADIAKEMESAQREKRSHFVFRHRLANQEIRDVEVHSGPVEIRGKVILYSIVHDITERRAAEQALQESEKNLRKLSIAVEHSASSVIITNKQGHIEYVNPRFTEITGYLPEEVLGKTPGILRAPGTSSSLYKDLWKTILAGNNWHGDLKNQRKNGDLYWSLQSISPVYNEHNEIIHFVSVSEDVTALKEAHARMEQLALYDSLTGLANRRLFQDRLKQFLEIAQRYQHGGALIYLDLDKFKNVNDSLGHDQGDRLLKEVAQRLRVTLRNSDTIARLGGDEFTVLLPHVHYREDIRDIAQKIIDTLREPITLRGRSFVVGASMGIAMIPEDGMSVDALLQNSDLALYHAKEEGRNTFRFFTSELRTRIQTKITLEEGLRRALEHKELVLYYQPIVNLQTNRIQAVEALLRWQHPERGLLGPNAFIPIAEESGLIVPLGDWVIQRACQDLQALQSHTKDRLTMAVNLSLKQLHDPQQLLNFLQKIQQQFHLQEGQLELELTESMLMDDFDSALNTLNQLKNMGIGLSIDDFGTGYSSFSYLKRLPINTLKVDRSFIKDITEQPDDKEITAAILSMASNLGLNSLAEGVETQEQLDMLRAHHCHLAQGYFFSRPLPINEMLALLDKQH